MSLRSAFLGLLAATLVAGEAPPLDLTIDPLCRRSVGGEGELHRDRYFALCDQGSTFDDRSPRQHQERLLDQAQAEFGRRFGVVHRALAEGALQEDPQRPGTVDRRILGAWLDRSRIASRPALLARFGGRLDIAAHEHPEAFPGFLGTYQPPGPDTDPIKQPIPDAMAEAAEVTAQVLARGYADSDRPRFYELINEPHWRYAGDARFAAWHRLTRERVQALCPDVKVGGPCLPTAYFYRRGYRSFEGLRQFIDHTEGALDFYSFHVYDYLKDVGGEFGGRITGGLPLEGVLDLVQAYGQQQFGHGLPIVVSEHGGYGAEDLVRRRAEDSYTGDRTSFAFELHRRAIDDDNMVRSAIANTMVFLDHPDTVLKAVPFILYETNGWNPSFYSALYVREDYRRDGAWHLTDRVHFYDFFRGVRGQRIAARLASQDIQVQAFRDVAAGEATVVLNNLSATAHRLRLAFAPGSPGPTGGHLRRLVRDPAGTGRLDDGILPADGLVALAPREAAVLTLPLPATTPTWTSAIDERTFYATPAAQKGVTTGLITIPPEVLAQARTATVRIGFSCAAATRRDLAVTWNGTVLPCPVEDAADRYTEQGGDYATCRLITLDPAQVQARNQIVVRWSGDTSGTVGSLALRLGQAVTP